MDTPERQIAKLLRDNRELTRQVEQLQARLKTETAIADRSCAEQVELEAKADAAKKLIEAWRQVQIISIGPSSDMRIAVLRDCANELEAALTAPPSSSDHGQADTGREER